MTRVKHSSLKTSSSASLTRSLATAVELAAPRIRRDARLRAAPVDRRLGERPPPGTRVSACLARAACSSCPVLCHPHFGSYRPNTLPPAPPVQPPDQSGGLVHDASDPSNLMRRASHDVRRRTSNLIQLTMRTRCSCLHIARGRLTDRCYFRAPPLGMRGPHAVGAGAIYLGEHAFCMRIEQRPAT